MFSPKLFLGAKKVGHLDQNPADSRVVPLEKGKKFMPDPVAKVQKGLV